MDERQVVSAVLKKISLPMVLILSTFELTAGCDDGGDTDGDADIDADGDIDGDGDGDGDSDGDGDMDEGLPPASEDWDRDILTTRLQVDVATMRGVAAIELASSESTGASFEVGGLEIASVKSGELDLEYAVEEGRLDVGVPRSAEPAVIVIEYGYEIQDLFEGAMESGSTLVWPTHCGNLFPCHSDPADGMTFELDVTGVPEGQTAVYAERIPMDAPSYMVAWAVGEYERHDLGETSGGTRLGFWYREGEESDAEAGGEHLIDIFEWLEANLGPYPFGPEAGVVAVSWGPFVAGGMEHHPFWHMSSNALDNVEFQAHEAAHGWIGDGVRLRCWEDYVVSEGTVPYLAAVILGEVVGPEAEAEAWEGYRRRLDRAMTGAGMRDVWPESCGEIDLIEDGLFGDIANMKGAFFFRALEERVGRESLVGAVGAFFLEHRGQAASVQDLLDAVAAQTGYDPTDCADAWLRGDSVPEQTSCP